MCSPSIFYAFSGCDKVPNFYSKRKWKVWDVWMQDRSDFDEAFICIRDRPRQNQIKMSLKTSLEDVHKIEQNIMACLWIDIFKYLRDNKLWKLLPGSREHTRRAFYLAVHVGKKQLVISLSLIRNFGYGNLKEIVSAKMATGKLSNDNGKFNFKIVTVINED